ncbi:MAG: NlpC/P60 family protein [Bacteroidales bacterium]|jgi:lipoprotein Spr
MKKRYLYSILLICSLSLSSCSFVKNLARNDREDEAWDIEWDSEGSGKTIKHKRDIKHNNKKTTQIPKTELTEYCKDWIGTPHVMGGMSKQGVDCSGFVDNVYMDVYGISLPRQSQDIEKVVEPIDDKTQLKEGDLVFFNSQDGKVNHVGIYIKEDTFVHASTSKGVMVSNLNEKYWTNIYRRGGRHPELKNKKNKNKKA